MSDAMIFFGIPALFAALYLSVGLVVASLLRYGELRFEAQEPTGLDTLGLVVVIWPAALGAIPYLIGSWLRDLELRNEK